MNLKFDKNTGLIPVIVQDMNSLKVLMLGYMNEQAYEQTKETRLITFYSRSKQRLWVKGESSGNVLRVVNMFMDCDQDALLISANPAGPTCHKGTTSCFDNNHLESFTYTLQQTITDRLTENNSTSYTSNLANKGIHKVAQKVGEEAVELVIEAMRNNTTDFKNEAADLMYHYLLLLKIKGFSLQDIEEVLRERGS